MGNALGSKILFLIPPDGPHLCPMIKIMEPTPHIKVKGEWAKRIKWKR
jgi:hypothetical protein